MISNMEVVDVGSLPCVIQIFELLYYVCHICKPTGVLGFWGFGGLGILGFGVSHGWCAVVLLFGVKYDALAM